jgi:hypothetical protein
MESVIGFIDKHREEIGKARAAAFANTRSKKTFLLDYAMNHDRRDTITFKGYEAKYKPSEVSGLPRLWYDRKAPYTKSIPYYNYFSPTLSVERPHAYIIPQAWEHVIDRLALNGVQMSRLEADVTLPVETYFIRDFKTRNAWEGHYYHSAVKLETKQLTRTFHKGDYVVFPDQDANRYIMETLEPQAPDSWFAWNFFEPVLAQKEYFSAYVFEDLAAQFLRENPAVRAELDAKRAADATFAADAAAQLDWVYRQSPWYEPTHRMYPIGRLLKEQALPLAR